MDEDAIAEAVKAAAGLESLRAVVVAVDRIVCLPARSGPASQHHPVKRGRTHRSRSAHGSRASYRDRVARSARLV
jgi:hypothetical protein